MRTAFEDLPFLEQLKEVDRELEIANRKDDNMTQSHDLDNIFTYHAPTDAQVVSYELIRNKAKEMAGIILSECPQSRERSLALTKLEESAMWANAAIARNKRPQHDSAPKPPDMPTDGIQGK